jgi:integrase
MSKVLTVKSIEAEKPGDKTREVLDGMLSKGEGTLYLRVRSTTEGGAREWFYRYTLDGTRPRIKLGEYPAMGLLEARELAKEKAALVKKGIDPKEQAELEREAAKEAQQNARLERARQRQMGTFGQLLQAYLKSMETKPSHPKVQSSLNANVIRAFPDLLEVKAKDIQPDDITAILSRMIDAGITTNANRVRSYLHAAFKFGMTADHDPRKTVEGAVFRLTANPVAKIPRQADFERVSHRALSPDEFQRLWEGAESAFSHPFGSLIRIMLTTGLRPSELNRAKWEHVDFEKRAIFFPSSSTKNKVPNLVPLCRYAWSEVEKLAANRLGDDLIPRREGAKYANYGREQNLAQAVRAARERLGIDFTARDIRRTFKTLAGEARLSKDIRDRLQNHAQTDVSSAHYDRYDYWEEKQEAVQKWERWLASKVFKHSATVTPLRRKA